jgi:hypothetical protein
MNNHWNVLYQVSVFYVDRKSKVAATAGHRLTLNPMGKCSNAFFSETTNNRTFVEDHPKNIPAKFGSNWPSGFRRRRLKCEKFTDDGRQVMAIVQIDLETC